MVITKDLSGNYYYTKNKSLLGRLKDAGMIDCKMEFSDSNASCSGGEFEYLYAGASGANYCS